jgi:hypothetical protein
MDTLGINLPEGEDLSVKEVKKGVFEVENAYEGTVEYFKGKPIPIEPSEKCTEPGEPPQVDIPIIDATAEAGSTADQSKG